jgi:hypothetical protein
VCMCLAQGGAVPQGHARSQKQEASRTEARLWSCLAQAAAGCWGGMWLLTQQGPGHKRDSESARTYSMRSVGRHKRGGEAQDDSGRSVLIWQLPGSEGTRLGRALGAPLDSPGKLGKGDEGRFDSGPASRNGSTSLPTAMPYPARQALPPFGFPLALAFPLAFRRQTVDSLSMLGGPAGPRIAGPAGSGYRPGFRPLAIESQ